MGFAKVVMEAVLQYKMCIRTCKQVEFYIRSNIILREKGDNQILEALKICLPVPFRDFSKNIDMNRILSIG
jgi:hypothetical protein